MVRHVLPQRKNALAQDSQSVFLKNRVCEEKLPLLTTF